MALPCGWPTPPPHAGPYQTYILCVAHKCLQRTAKIVASLILLTPTPRYMASFLAALDQTLVSDLSFEFGVCAPQASFSLTSVPNLDQVELWACSESTMWTPHSLISGAHFVDDSFSMHCLHFAVVRNSRMRPQSN